MATTVEDMMGRAARMYGWHAGVEHEVFTHKYFVDRLNERLAEMADKAGGWREEFTINLATTMNHALSLRVIRIIDNTVRVDYDNDAVFELEPQLISEDELRNSHGVLDSYDASSPSYYYTQRGSTSADPWNLMLFPKSDTAVTNGVKLWARTTATVITAIGDNLPLQQGEERILMPGLMYSFAQTELNRGVKGAPVGYWQDEWKKALDDMIDRVEDGMRGSHRRVKHLEAMYDYT